MLWKKRTTAMRVWRRSSKFRKDRDIKLLFDCATIRGFSCVLPTRRAGFSSGRLRPRYSGGANQGKSLGWLLPRWTSWCNVLRSFAVVYRTLRTRLHRSFEAATNPRSLLRRGLCEELTMRKKFSMEIVFRCASHLHIGRFIFDGIWYVWPLSVVS